MTLHVYAKPAERHVAMIRKQSSIEDGIQPEVPWVLLHNTGRVDRFGDKAAAVAEAAKTYHPCIFKRT